METKTTFEVRAVILGAISKHPNADTLSLTEVLGNPVVIKTGAFKEGDCAVYVPVDCLVPTNRPEFSFLAAPGKEKHRIRAAKLRGIFSMGLLVPMPVGVKFDPEADFAPILGVEKYLNPTELSELKEQGSREWNRQNRASKVKGPQLYVYGVDSYRKLSKVLKENEEVYLSEKVHGSNVRMMHDGSRLWVGSHKVMRGGSKTRFEMALSNAWLAVKSFFGVGNRAPVGPPQDTWWRVADNYGLKEKLAKRPNFVLYGEVYGQKIQELTYDSPVGTKFLAFDVMDFKTGKFLNYKEFVEFCRELDIPTVPVLYIGPWTPEVEAEAKKRAEGKSTLNSKQIMEGFVLKPVVERMDPACGRVILKYVSQNYLLSKEG